MDKKKKSLLKVVILILIYTIRLLFLFDLAFIGINTRWTIK